MTETTMTETTMAWKKWLSVAELNERIRALLEEGFPHVRVRGEISDLRAPASGHVYFQLIDRQSRLRAVVWRGTRARLGMIPRSGEAVMVTGRIVVYPPRGEYQLIVEAMRPDGAGAERERFLRLFSQLKAEGLFDEKNKRPLPFLPQTIGVVTSASGAAIHDILKVLERRFPGFHLILCHATVQGDQAPAEICAALDTLVRDGRSQVIICGRGGGSADDLSCFNTEIVARAIANSPIPVVSAVGHEVDLTLADLAADARAPTPSAAAERVMPDRGPLVARINTLQQRLFQGLRNQHKKEQQRLDHLRNRMRHPQRHLEQNRLRCDELTQRLILAAHPPLRRHQQTLAALANRLHAWPNSGYFVLRRARLGHAKEQLPTAARHLLARHRQGVLNLVARLEGVSPVAILQRGYAIVRDQKEQIVRDSQTLTRGEILRITLSRGTLEAVITQIEEPP